MLSQGYGRRPDTVRLFTWRSVSYTHLDVYKRQEEWRELSVPFAAGKAAEENNCFIRDYEMENSGLTVRFYNDKTEIDVYKRQSLLRLSEQFR